MTAPVQDAIVLFGDSITQKGWESGGFAHKLAHVYARKLDVINRGFSGYNTEWAIPVFEQCLVRRNVQTLASKIRLLTIWFGANDSCLPSSFQHVPLAKYGENLTRLIHMVTAPTSAWHSPSTKIVLITPPPINTHQRPETVETESGLPGELDRAFAVTAEYAQKVRQIGLQERIPVLDAWQALWDVAGQKEEALNMYLTDGLHLAPAGYSVVYDELIKIIEENFPELHYDRLQTVFSLYDQIDVNNPRVSLSKRGVDG
ncbi:SGNH hydrolase [Phellopilus nigrolimitatus]|nr:SGNH hydrolase [Phellopilus nigrolimitatus]